MGNTEEFDESKLRYGKIILMCDADVDGSHIRTLLLTFFYRHMQEVITKEKLYIAQPPLYKIKNGKEELYAYNENEKEQLLKRFKSNGKPAKGKKEIKVEEGSEPQEPGTQTGKGPVISRFKGLGEMNPEQLWATTMNPETRTILRVTIENAIAADKMFETLMGEEVEPRRQFIQKNAKYVKNLDV
jgi:DNA gyrase subunit B